MVKTRPSTKMQTRLSFQPLPSSSPAKASQPSAVRDRAAAVTILGSPSSSSASGRKRKLDHTHLPTPEKSSQPQLHISSSSDSESDRNNNASSSKPSTRSTRLKMEPSTPRKRPEAEGQPHFFDDSESDDSVFNDKQKVTPSKRGKRSSPVLVDDSESDAPIRSHKKKTPKTTEDKADSSDRDVDEQAESDEEQSEDSLPVKRGRNPVRARPQSFHKFSSRDREDLDEDLEFLEPANEDSPRLSRNKVTPKKLAKQSALDRLKKERAIRQGRESSPVEEVASEVEEDEEDDSPARPRSGGHLVHIDEDDFDDFVDDEDADPDEDVVLPFEFSNQSTQKPKHYMHSAVLWMVQKKINPTFAVNDEVYKKSFEKLDDYARGMGGSKFQSSAWTPEFTQSLKKRPNLEYDAIPSESLELALRDHCDACNRSKHPPKFQVRFTGHAYDEYTLEVSSDEDSSDEDNSGDDDADDNSVPSSNRLYYLGRFCMQNARRAHALAHWKHHLNRWVVDYLDTKGYFDREQVARRADWSARRKGKLGHKIVEAMTEDGEIKRLYHDWKTQIEEAQEETNDFS